MRPPSSPRRARVALAPIAYLLLFQLPPPSPLLVRAFRCGSIDDNTTTPSFHHRRRRRRRCTCHRPTERTATPSPPSSSSMPLSPPLLLRHHDDGDEGAVVSRHRRPHRPHDDWECRSLRRRYRDDGDVLYKTSALSRAEYTTVCDELRRLYESNSASLADEGESSSFATRRKGMRVSRSDSPTLYGVFENKTGGMLRLVNAVMGGGGAFENAAAGGKGNNFVYATEEGGASSSSGTTESSMVLAPDVPIEVREMGGFRDPHPREKYFIAPDFLAHSPHPHPPSRFPLTHLLPKNGM